MTWPARSVIARLRRLDRETVDGLVALALLVAIELQVWLDPSAHHPIAAAVSGVASAGAVAVRRRWPLGAILVAVGAALGSDALGGPNTVAAVGTIPAGILVSYGAGAFLAERRARVALALGAGGLALDVLITTRSAADLFFDVVVIALLPWSMGQMLRARAARERAHRESAERLDSERELRARTAAYGERARIARELHDVIAHSVSVMVIQAGGARVVMDSDPEGAEASLRLVERAGREALAEMRHLLGMLDGRADPPATAPQPRLADLTELLERTRTAGIEADLRVEGDAPAVSPALDLCAYRIVQEALTNTIKHAGPARVRVRLRWAHDALELDVSDDGRGPAVAGAASGHGIAGMRERAALHGGSVSAGAGSDGGFAVHARLPLTRERVR